MEYPPPPSISRSTTPEKIECCIAPPNPWLINGSSITVDSSGNLHGGCNCDCDCVSSRARLGIRYRSASPPRNIPIEEKIAYFDNRAIAFSNSAGAVNRALDAALITPSSYTGSVGVIFSQDAAAAANNQNLQGTVAPQEAAVAAAITAVAATKASRLAYRSMTEASNALNSVNNISVSELAPLLAKAKLATEALLTQSNDANAAAQAVYSTASAITASANTALSLATDALEQVECDAAKASCNAVPGSTQAMVTARRNIIAIDASKRNLELVTNSTEKAIKAEESVNAVAITMANAKIAASAARDAAIEANTPFLLAAEKKSTSVQLFAAYKSNPTPSTLAASNLANQEAAAANAVLPPLQKLKDLVVATSLASSLANIAAANSRTLSTSLDIEARAAAAPIYNPVTPQMIAKQTAAAERFGAAAAAAESRNLRLSAAPPPPPDIIVPKPAIYRVQQPPLTVADRLRNSQLRAKAAVKSMAINTRLYNPF